MSQSIHLVFCGTPQFAVPTLERLVDGGFAVDLVVTQPDRPRGRGMEMAFSPIKQRARELGLPVTQPDRIKNNEEFRTQLANLKPDAIIVVGYGRIIPQWMIDLPPLGNINLHASLLPKYRGAAPIQWAIASGETVTGVTTIRIDAGLDTGDILLQREIPIAPEDTAETLAPRMAAIGAELMVETLHGLKSGTIHPAGRFQSNSSAAAQERRRPNQLSPSRAGDRKSHSRFSALAGRLHNFSRQESAHMDGETGRAPLERGRTGGRRTAAYHGMRLGKCARATGVAT